MNRFAAFLGVLSIVAAVFAVAWWFDKRWREDYIKALDKAFEQRREQIRRNNELMVDEALHCARTGGVPVRVDVMHAPPQIHCAR